MTGNENVGVVLVEYHSGGLVAARVAEMMALGCSVVVADNSGCYDGPGTTVDTGGNIGFGPACNLGVAALPPSVDVVVLQNPDAHIDERGLSELVAAIRSGWAAVAPALASHGSRVRPHGFAVPGLGREMLLTMREALGARRSRARPFGGVTVSRAAGARQGVVACKGRFGSAALLALSRTAFDGVQGFDEDYFLYAEDLDLWYRMEAAGFRVGFAPSVVVHHEGAAGSPAGVSRRIALRWLGRELFADRVSTNARWIRVVHRAGALFLSRDDEVVETIRSGFARGESAAELNERIRGVRTFPPSPNDDL